MKTEAQFIEFLTELRDTLYRLALSITCDSAEAGEGQAHALLEGRHGIGVIQGVQGNDANLILIHLISLLHVGELIGAGAAGGVEEVDEDHVLLLQHLGQLHSSTISSHDREIIHHIAKAKSRTGQALIHDERGGQRDVG